MPLASVTVVSDVPRLTSLIVTEAPGTIPLESETVPTMVPVVTWAAAGEQNRQTSTVRRAVRQTCRILMAPSPLAQTGEPTHEKQLRSLRPPPDQSQGGNARRSKLVGNDPHVNSLEMCSAVKRDVIRVRYAVRCAISVRPRRYSPCSAPD